MWTLTAFVLPLSGRYDVSHIHAIFNHKGENLLKTDKVSLEYSDKNEFTPLYTLHIKPDGTYEIFFDLESKAKGKMVDDWAFPKPTIDDPDDKKPSDWVDETEIDDPEDKKPEGYDDIPAQASALERTWRHTRAYGFMHWPPRLFYAALPS